MSFVTTMKAYYDAKIGNVYYSLNKTLMTALVSDNGNNSYTGAITIPDNILYQGQSYDVVGIADNAFKGSTALTSVIIPNSVKSIGYNAFYGCSGLESIEIPDGVEKIDKYAFNGCTKLSKVVLPESDIIFGNNIFSGCTSLPVIDNLRYADTYLVEAVDKTLTTYNILETTKYIGSDAFNKCSNLSKIKIPEKVRFVGEYAFDDCKSLPIKNNIRYADTYLVEAIDKTLDTYIIDEKTKFIGSWAFYGCSAMSSVSIPENVLLIANLAFRNCSSLTEITIPENVICIEEDAFKGCTNIKKLNYNAKNAHTVCYSDHNSYYSPYPTSYNELNIGEHVESLPDFLASNCKELQSVIIPDNVKKIGSSFEKCTGLTSVDLSNGLAIIDNSAFMGCSNISSITIPNSVTNIGRGAFLYCTGLASITIPNSLTTIDALAFGYCTSLSKVFCEAENPLYLKTGVFAGSPVSNATLYVPSASIEAYKTADQWKDFGTIKRIANANEFILYDGELFYAPINHNDVSVTYTRTFNNTNWQALYVPFAMNFDDWVEDFDLAEINNFHEYDDDLDGLIDRTELEILYVTSGDILPNTPYLIRAKETGEKTITLTDATLHKTEVNSVDCSSVKTKYTFTGTYDGVSGEEMYNNGYYALAGGSLKQAASTSASLGAFRWYLKAESRTNNAKARAKEIKICIDGANDEVTSISNAKANDTKAEYFTLSGAKVANADVPGVYVVKNSDGTTKKIIKK